MTTETKTSEQKVTEVANTTKTEEKTPPPAPSAADTDVDRDDEDDKKPIWEYEENGWKIVHKKVNEFIETFYQEVVSKGVFPKKKQNSNPLKLGENSNQNNY